MKRKLKKKRDTRFDGLPRHVARLYKAVENYVRKHNGTIMVIGGIQIVQWPNDGEFRYSVSVPCTGNRPVFKEPK